MPQPEAGVLDILFEDEHMLVLNKPPGIVVHPAYKNQTGTVLNTLLAHTADARLVHRLDKDTSGVLLVAKSSGMNATLQRALAQTDARKVYLAVVEGHPAKARGTIGLPLGVDPGDARIGVARSDPSGMLATPVETVRRGKGDLRRIHQILAEEDAVEVVMGLPRSLAGGEGPAALKTREFAVRLARRIADRKSTRLNSSHSQQSRMPSSA